MELLLSQKIETFCVASVFDSHTKLENNYFICRDTLHDREKKTELPKKGQKMERKRDIGYLHSVGLVCVCCFLFTLLPPLSLFTDIHRQHRGGSSTLIKGGSGGSRGVRELTDDDAPQKTLKFDD